MIGVVVAWAARHWILSSLLGLEVVSATKTALTGKGLFAGKTTLTETVLPGESIRASLGMGSDLNLDSPFQPIVQMTSSDPTVLSPTVASGLRVSATVKGKPKSSATLTITFKDKSTATAKVTVT